MEGVDEIAAIDRHSENSELTNIGQLLDSTWTKRIALFTNDEICEHVYKFRFSGLKLDWQVLRVRMCFELLKEGVDMVICKY